MGLQGLIRWIIPREDRFYTWMEKQALLLHQAASALAEFKPGGATPEELLPRVDEFEHEGDRLLHEVENALASTFITPIDREDIHRLSTRLDDILDLIKTTAQTYVLYDVNEPSPPMTQLMELLVKCAETLHSMMPLLRKHSYLEISESTRKMFQLEKEADSVYRAAVGALFHDPMIEAKELLREKEVLEDLERAINTCENAADVLSNLAVKHG